MRKIARVIIAGLICISVLSCSGQQKEANMDEIIKAKLALTKQYGTQPVYGAQVNKTSCKVIIEGHGTNDYRLTDNTGESMMVPLNILILKSGPQNLKVTIYPKDGEQYLTKYSTASITIYGAADKETPMKAYRKLAAFELPSNIGTKQIPVYETVLSFDADVPYNYQKELDNAKDLKNIPDIEQMVVKKYNELRDMGIHLDENAYLLSRLHSSGQVSNTTYKNTYEAIKKSSEVKFAIVDNHPAITDRKFLPIENYTMQFYANGKIVALWQKNHRPMLYMTALFHKGTEDEEQYEGGDPIFLYMPEGSDELKVW